MFIHKTHFIENQPFLVHNTRISTHRFFVSRKCFCFFRRKFLHSKKPDQSGILACLVCVLTLVFLDNMGKKKPLMVLVNVMIKNTAKLWYLNWVMYVFCKIISLYLLSKCVSHYYFLKSVKTFTRMLLKYLFWKCIFFSLGRLRNSASFFVDNTSIDFQILFCQKVFSVFFSLKNAQKAGGGIFVCLRIPSPPVGERFTQWLIHLGDGFTPELES